MSNKNSSWELAPHSKGKHLVLKAYLDAWMGIGSNRFESLLFVDGFSGPGEYLNGQYGSPLIALNCLIEHSHNKLRNFPVDYIFIEADQNIINNLKKEINDKFPNIPNNINITFIQGEFDKVIHTTVVPKLKSLSNYLAFIMIDPFGVKQIPMSTLALLLKFKKVELYISFMYENINRFKKEESFASHIDELYGSSVWRESIAIEDNESRRLSFIRTYKNSLKTSGANQVVHFDVFDGKKYKYAVFSASQHIRAAEKIKEAIWKVDPSGKFAFKGLDDSQLLLNGLSNTEGLQDQLINKFSGRGWVTMKEIQDFVSSDETLYYLGQLKTKTLKPMELRDDICMEVRVASGNRRKSSFPNDSKIKIDKLT